MNEIWIVVTLALIFAILIAVVVFYGLVFLALVERREREVFEAVTSECLSQTHRIRNCVSPGVSSPGGRLLWRTPNRKRKQLDAPDTPAVHLYLPVVSLSSSSFIFGLFSTGPTVFQQKRFLPSFLFSQTVL